MAAFVAAAAPQVAAALSCAGLAAAQVAELRLYVATGGAEWWLQGACVLPGGPPLTVVPVAAVADMDRPLAWALRVLAAS